MRLRSGRRLTSFTRYGIRQISLKHKGIERCTKDCFAGWAKQVHALPFWAADSFAYLHTLHQQAVDVRLADWALARRKHRHRGSLLVWVVPARIAEGGAGYESGSAFPESPVMRLDDAA
jgi:hypothetical protein